MRISKFLTIIMSINAAMVVLVVLAAADFDIPFLRQLIGFVFLTFVPGLLIIRILRIRNLGYIETLLYSVGLSIAFVMFLGVLVNLLYPVVGIVRPISTPPLIATFALVIASLCVIAYIQERRETVTQTGNISIPWAEALSPPALFLLLLPFLSAIGAYYLANFYQNNVLLLVLIALIAVVASLIAFNKFIPQKLYPLAIAMIAISLLFHWSLISQHIWGYDIRIEYYFHSLVLDNGFWDSTIRSNVNSMLSVVMLTPIYSLMLNMDSVWIFKIVCPLLFSLLPLVLFQIFRKQTDDRIAFFTTFFFMSFSQFFTAMIDLPRQQIAELFFVLFVLLLLDTAAMTASKKRGLLMVFSLSIVVSHYGLSYFVLFYLILSLFLLFLMRHSKLNSLWRDLTARFSRDKNTPALDGLAHNSSQAPFSTNSLTTTLVFLFITLCFAWYMYIGAGAPFNSIVNVGVHIYTSIARIFFIQAREAGVLMALGLASPEITSVQRYIFLVVQYITQLFIIVGFIRMMLNQIKPKFRPEYTAMTIVSSILLLMCIVLPYFSKHFNISRIYHVTLLFLAPFFVLGGIAIFRWLFRVMPSRLFRASTSPVYLKLVVILILVPYFLFSTAFIYAITGDEVTSMALNPEMDSPRFNVQEVSGKEWLLSGRTTESRVCADNIGKLLLYEHILFREVVIFYGETSEIPDNTYIYLRSLNVKQGKVMPSWEERSKYIELQSSPFGKEVLAYRNKIYDNGGAQVYYQQIGE